MPSLLQYALEAVSGRRRTAPAAAVRTVLCLAEAPYTAVVWLRNILYDRGVLPVRRLAVPVVSVGNLTTGGTGKTPAVQWLAAQLRLMGMHPAVLLRGYKPASAAISDEHALLAESLGGPGGPAIVRAAADRHAGALRTLREHPDVDVLILDDGFQHRQLHRVFDLVLIDATNPFGYGRLLPRGLLREPPRGLKRANALVLTRCDQISPETRAQIEADLRRWNASAPLYLARHVIDGLRTPAAPAWARADLVLESLTSHRFFAVAGIARPDPLRQQLEALPGNLCGWQWFDDHHDYTETDLRQIWRLAASAGASVILVTEKDWVKLRRLPQAAASPIPIRRLSLQFVFEGGREQELIRLIRNAMGV